MVTDISHDVTEAGNYFIANYPPFSFWNKENLPAIEKAFATPASSNVPLGLYLHIPFCRKRCKFCYFRVYTDINAQAIQTYVDSLSDEIGMVAHQPAVEGREIRFVYFGGGTPSYLSAKQLEKLADKLRQNVTWDKAEEVTFECEPGTLSETKLETLKAIGVTRLSLGVENFSDAILEENGRAHLSNEIYRCWDWVVKQNFAQINIDLIAGMVGETTENWKENIRKTIELNPTSVTIYQMELPFNTKYAKDLQVIGQTDVATWSTKRSWLEYAYDEMGKAGYRVSSAYTLVKETGNTKFQYRDNLWRGCDLLGTGVASFGHLQGVHYQNVDGLETYQNGVATGQLPLSRALTTTPKERLIREMILQLKLGKIDAGYFRDKFGVDILVDFASEYDRLRDRSMLDINGDLITLTRDGILRIDSLLPAFFLPEHRGDRYA